MSRKGAERSAYLFGALGRMAAKFSSLFPINCRARFAGILVLTASLLFGACSADDVGRKQDPVLFGSASGTNGGGGATSGMSFAW